MENNIIIGDDHPTATQERLAKIHDFRENCIEDPGRNIANFALEKSSWNLEKALSLYEEGKIGKTTELKLIVVSDGDLSIKKIKEKVLAIGNILDIRVNE